MTEQKQRRKPRKYTDEFKQQLVDLYHAGKKNVISAVSMILPHPCLING